MCLGYVVAFSIKGNKWNVFPTNNDNKEYYVKKTNIKNMLNIIKAYENEGVDLIENLI